MVMHSAHAVMSAMRRKFAAPEYALLENVPNAVGGGSRRADALVMGLWKSRGIDLSGYEIKVSRSDVLRELKDPSKAETLADYCDFWWLVVGDPKIVKLEEVPANWGLLVPDGKATESLVVAKKAVRLHKPKPVDRQFLAAMLRVTVESFGVERIRRDVRSEIYGEIRDAMEAQIEGRFKMQLDTLQRERDAAITRAEKADASLAAVIDSKLSPAQIARASEIVTKMQNWQGGAQTAEIALRNAESAANKLNELLPTFRAIEEFATSLRPDNDR